MGREGGFEERCRSWSLGIPPGGADVNKGNCSALGGRRYGRQKHEGQ